MYQVGGQFERVVVPKDDDVDRYRSSSLQLGLDGIIVSVFNFDKI